MLLLRGQGVSQPAPLDTMLCCAATSLQCAEPAVHRALRAFCALRRATKWIAQTSAMAAMAWHTDMIGIKTCMKCYLPFTANVPTVVTTASSRATLPFTTPRKLVHGLPWNDTLV